jgi:ferredoxin
VSAYAQLFQDSDQRLDHKRARLEDVWRERINRTIDLCDIEHKLIFDNAVWEQLAPACVDCGICTFLCPTCHCFDIQDEGVPEGGARIRLWDSCAFYDYTKTQAEQPRPAHYGRYRQRILHKFRYYPENFGKTLCVGCGRCIQYCPVGVDLFSVLERAKASVR